MNETPQVYEAQVMDIVRNPKVVLAEAKEAADELVKVVRKAKLAQRFGGQKEHLFFEAWQTCGKFYGCTPKVKTTEYVEFGTAHGFEAKAVVVDRNGIEVSAAEAMCLSDEANWKNKPLFQLKSMAQTRACSKALRNVFAWVAVLAGFDPTPAEEMTGDEHRSTGNQPSGMKEPGRKSESGNGQPAKMSEAQQRKIFAQLKQLGVDEEERHGYCGLVLEKVIESLNDLTVQEASQLIKGLDQRIENQKVV